MLYISYIKYVLCIQIPTAATADAEDSESQLTNDTTAVSADGRPLTPVKPDFPPAAGDFGKTPTSSAWSEESVQPFSSK